MVGLMDCASRGRPMSRVLQPASVFKVALAAAHSGTIDGSNARVSLSVLSEDHARNNQIRL